MRGRRVGGLVVAACLALPAMAEASKLEAAYSPQGCCEIPERVAYRYLAAPGETNNVNLDRSATLGTGVVGYAATIVSNVRLGDTGALITSTPVLQLMPEKVGVATLCTPAFLPAVLCLSQAWSVGVYADLGDRNDRLKVGEWAGPTGTWGADLRIDGGSGDDTIADGAGGDSLNGQDGDDRIILTADARVDHVTCGPGIDTVTQVSGSGTGDVIDADCEVVN